MSRERAWIEARARRRAADDARRAAEARERLPGCVQWLAAAGARRVWLVGSLARGRFGRRSDIDLAVEGLAPEAYVRALTGAARAAAPFSLDLLPIEDLPALDLSAAEPLYG